MSSAERDPSVMVSATIRSHRKILALPSVDARWAYIVCLGEAKLRRPPGQFDNRAVLDYRMAEMADHVNDLIRVGLLHVAPVRCRDCRERLQQLLRQIAKGMIVVHDWHVHQRTSTERVQKHRLQPVSETPVERSRNAPETLHTRAHRPSHIAVTSSSLGGGPGEGETEGPILTWLASIGATIPATGNGFHVRLVKLVDRHGPERVLAEMRRLHDDGARTDRQLLFGAENALDTIPAGKTGSKPKGLGPSPEEVDHAFNRR